ncbi:MAG: hypothetical protein AB7G13_11305 [Lautropia sp.]
MTPARSATAPGGATDEPDDASVAGGRIARTILEFIGQVPATEQTRHRNPAGKARRIGNAAAARAALAAGGLALPPGPLGWLTILPELQTVWKQQAQMVADIAGVHGRADDLTPAMMLYCLFRHIAPGAFRPLVRHEGGKVVFAPATPRVLRAVALKIGARISLRVLGRGVSRWVPVVGALGVGAFAFYDTGRVAATAGELFSQPIDTL